jgi:hypothetical protein
MNRVAGLCRFDRRMDCRCLFADVNVTGEKGGNGEKQKQRVFHG